MVTSDRSLLVTADDFGIGPATSQGILALAAHGLLTGTVLLVTSPHAAAAVAAWRRSGEPCELGWHPCLTLDRPAAPAALVPSLVDAAGRFWPLGSFLRRLWLGQIRPVDLETELRAQYERFRDLVGRPPLLVNAHHHVQVFGPIGSILGALLAGQQPVPYLRRVQEPRQTLCSVPGARAKRLLLSSFGKRAARGQARCGLPGNDWLIGITNPAHVGDPQFLTRWLARVPGTLVELTCHPGYLDASLVGRDCVGCDAQLLRRPREFALLKHPRFRQACAQAGFDLLGPDRFRRLLTHPTPRAA